jgi:hypothetical protein
VCIPLVSKRIENTRIDNDHADTILSTEALTKHLIHSRGYIAAPTVPHPHEGGQWAWTLDREYVKVCGQPKQIFDLVLTKPVNQVVKLLFSSHTGKYRARASFAPGHGPLIEVGQANRLGRQGKRDEDSASRQAIACRLYTCCPCGR